MFLSQLTRSCRRWSSHSDSLQPSSSRANRFLTSLSSFFVDVPPLPPLQAHRAFRVSDVLAAAVSACAATSSDERYRMQV